MTKLEIMNAYANCNEEFTKEELNEMMVQTNKRQIDTLTQTTKTNTDDIIKINAELDNINKSIKTKEDEINQTKDEVKVLKLLTNVLRNDNTGKLEDYKRKCNQKIKSLLGHDKTNSEYILFNNCYRCWIYSDIHRILNVPKADCINIDDYNLALELIKKWRPAQWQKDKKLQEYIKLQELEKLDVTKSKSLDEYLSKTNGGAM